MTPKADADAATTAADMSDFNLAVEASSNSVDGSEGATADADIPTIAPRVPQVLLTDDLGLLSSFTTGTVSRWNGHANPVPPSVHPAYWEKLYNRADTFHCQCLQKQFREQTGKDNRKRSLEGKQKDTHFRAAILGRNKQNREARVTWYLALEYLVCDLVQTAEFDFPHPLKRLEEKNGGKAKALRQTRVGLPREFFDFLESRAGVKLCPRDQVDPVELDPHDPCGPRWYGEGELVTTMVLS
ncbi:hypothetical protein B0T25DRAFT_576736 [Lasiosphaeria hispida]|uniref:Uncharacterized protein n=1 Tax=Lasiosphaeria hispida TaxID=260671 RepID=A0AAJ0HX17_9PEZI|nr:hypothetical protein B0T25DRAFT_576736 [Lasiosphaeria hispida]